MPRHDKHMSQIRVILPGVIIVAMLLALGLAGVATLKARPTPPANLLATPPAPPAFMPAGDAPVAPPNTLGSVPRSPSRPPVAAAVKAF